MAFVVSLITTFLTTMSTENTANEEHRLKKYQWPKGISGNPAGRPKGSISPRDKIRQMFELNPETFEEFLEKYIEDPRNRTHVIEMLDGKPRQGMDVEISIPQTLVDLIKYGFNKDGDNKVPGEDTN